MAEIYTSAGMRIDATKGTLVNELGEERKLRPKTFQLLLFLIRSSEMTFSKAEIMAGVWPDVVVGEHVVFQSIKEIRQLFEHTDVLKTEPRKGYTWIVPVTAINEEQSTEQQNKKTNRKRISPTFLALVAVCILLVVVLIQLTKPKQQPIAGSILILPVQIATDDNDHDWVQLGGMDQLTQRLASSATSGVLHTDYVLDVMDRAQITDYAVSEDDVQQIFKVSGATLVVELELAGTPRDYQLSYKLHRRNDVNKGVLFGEHIRDVFEKIARKLAAEDGIGLLEQEDDYSSGFANELIANALEAKRAGDSQKAQQLLQAAILSQPDNLTTKRLLLEILVANREFAQSDPLVDDAIAQIEQSQNAAREHVRLYFWSAMNQLQKQEIAAAEPFLSQAEQLARELKDWLYLAYIAEIRGQIAQYNKDFTAAKQAYIKAMDYHDVLQCPHGQSNGLLNLSMLAMEQGEVEGANQYLSQALTLIEQRELTTLVDKAQDWSATLNANNS